MKKTVTIIGAVLLVAAIAYPVFAWGPGWGGMHRSMGWGNGPMYGGNSGYGYGTLDKEQATKLDQLRQNFFKDTNDLRKDLWNKSRELGSVMNAENPDTGKAEALQNEINDLRAKLSQKRLSLQLETRKIVPNTERGEGYGPGYGHGMMGYGPGYGQGMSGYGHGPGMMGYGQHRGGFGGGACWN
ncbi:MAG: periplasmic heavy metal sensor [Desulfatiglandaceae bacterium]